MNVPKACLALAMALFWLSASPAVAGSLDSFSDMLGNLSDMARAADRAHDDYRDAMNGGRDYGRYERDWRQRESDLERERVRAMARMAGVSESRIRNMRQDGMSWGGIARRYTIAPDRFYGRSPYDNDRDNWRGNPPGLAKKGGTPQGLKRRAACLPDRQKKCAVTTITDPPYIHQRPPQRAAFSIADMPCTQVKHTCLCRV